MPIQKELREFVGFLDEKLRNSDAELSPEEALDEWRTIHSAEADSEEEVAAIQETLDDLANGEIGTLYEEFDRDFRERHHLPKKQ